MKDYSKIRTYFKENLYIVIPMCLTALLFNGLMCLLPVIEGRTIDSLYSNDFNIVRNYCIFFICLVLFVQFNRFCKRYLVRVFGNKMSLRMREVSLNNLFKKDINYFSDHTAGDILNRNISDIYDTTEGIRKMTTECFDTVVLLLGYLIMMFITDYELTLIVIPFLLISILVAQGIKRVVYKYNKDYKEYLSINKEIIISRLNNELYYRGFGVNDNYYLDYDKSVDILKKKNLKASLFQSSLEPLYLCVAMLGAGLVAYVGGNKVINIDTYTIGILSSFITTYALVAKKVGKISKVFNAYQGFKVSWARCKDMMAETKEEDVKYDINNLDLKLENVSFKYDDNLILDNINIEIKGPKLIGICGIVHSGKTSLLRALSGYYSYEGNIILDNIELTDLIKDKTQYIGFCQNEMSLFSDTIRNNISLNREGNLAKALEVSRFNESLEEVGGLDMILSHTNSNLSGGQQKRLQLARTLYNSPKLILLDDPFQSVSPNMAYDIIKDLKRYDNSIIIFVSNNKELLKEADNIIYIEDKKCIYNSYDNLLNNPNFRKLVE